MSTRLVGIGLLSIAAVVGGAAGGYLAFKTDRASAEAATPVAKPIADTPAPPPIAKPADVAQAPMPPRTPVRTMVSSSGKPIKTHAPVQQPRTEPVAVTTTSIPSPAVTPAPPPIIPAPPATIPAPPATKNDTPVPTPTPAAAEPSRYVPDSPVTQPAATPDPPRIEFEELTVPKYSVIGIRLDAPISTRSARVEDRVSATVSRDVTVAGRTAIAAGVRLEGTVVLVERGGRFRNRPRLGLQFERVILADGTRVNLKTDTIYLEGDSPSADATARVGTGAVAGAILGAVIGGKKGAAIGTAAGAAGGVASVMRGEPGEASMAGGAPLTVRLTDDVAILTKRDWL